ncbi:peptide chain release factor N(5)-glutamine methyltransferase [Parafilimonas terrae]|uniref:peptide chain release factor N(5)-glutamine methyltransferase n=1 Tax=Parafilimonas terrae TaxID=1465490 RepID=A0A1I5W9Z3_9BACT|nr:peptide chain release factor N(5)-glutamine methyltransferase [Parafilimonas terrae]SFQ16509.1 release factor glutamine methyltransferase [Parafilimonas terrae]
MTISEAGKILQSSLNTIYDQREASNISNLLMEKLTGFSRSERMIYKDNFLTDSQVSYLKKNIERLLQNTPVQYIINETWFAGMPFYVDENVLIPRPETEELVELILQNSHNSGLKAPSVLDIGTGSGCIAISIKKKFPGSNVYALDISDKSLEIAIKNAVNNNVSVHFFEADILNFQPPASFPRFDIIVSNPPYIAQSESSLMQPNVLQYEPHQALFVPDDDPLLFYKAIAGFALQHLKRPGQLYFEINELMGEQVAALLHAKGFTSVGIKKDMQQKKRMVSAFLV